MAKKRDEPEGRSEARQDPLVERLRPDPSKPAQEVTVFVGLRGCGEQEDRCRLYFTRELDYCVEFALEDVVYEEPVPRDQAPLVGLEATRVALKRGASVEYRRTRTAEPVDEFDLDIRLGPSGSQGRPPRAAGTIGVTCQTFCGACTWEAECPGPTGDCGTEVSCICGETHQITLCRGNTCVDVNTCLTCETQCNTQCGGTCQTCPTQCETQCGTCQTCQTCATQCGTCQTCATQCGTCETCDTQCGPTCQTCATCLTCNPHVFTCGPQCVLP